MANRISWTNFPRLQDHDTFDVIETAGPLTQLTLTLRTAPNVTWWKAIKVVNRATGQIVNEGITQDADHGPKSLTISAVQANAVKVIFAKAKIFGIHTDMYEIYEIREKLGRQISFTWITDRPDNVWGAIGSFFSDVVNGGVQAIRTVGNAIATAIRTVVHGITNAIAFVVSAILEIPIIGRLISLVINLVAFIVGWIANALVDGVFGILGIIGINQPDKILRLQIIIQRHPITGPVATIDQIRPQLDFLVKLFKERANIKVIPGGPFKFTTPFNSTPAPVEEFITELDKPSNPQTLDVRCGIGGFLDDFGLAGAGFQAMINELYWGNTQRLIGYGAPLVVFAVRNYTDGRVGCALGPTVNYITAQFSTSQYSLLAHEIGHACALLHAGDSINLMFHISPAPMPMGDLNEWLTNEQVFVIRASSRVAYV